MALAIAQEALSTFLQTKASNASTQRAYRLHLESAFQILNVQALEDLTAARLAAWREHLTSDGHAHATQALAISAMRSFLSWVAEQSDQDLPRPIRQVLRSPKRQAPSSQPSRLTESEVASIYAAAEGDLRDQAILALLLGAGLLASEVVTLQVADLHFVTQGWALHVQGPRSGGRMVPLCDQVALAVLYHLETARLSGKNDSPMFLAMLPANDAITAPKVMERAAVAKREPRAQAKIGGPVF